MGTRRPSRSSKRSVHAVLSGTENIAYVENGTLSELPRTKLSATSTHRTASTGATTAATAAPTASEPLIVWRRLLDRLNSGRPSRLARWSSSQPRRATTHDAATATTTVRPSADVMDPRLDAHSRDDPTPRSRFAHGKDPLGSGTPRSAHSGRQPWPAVKSISRKSGRPSK